MRERNYILRSVPGSFALSAETSDRGKTLYRKELAYPGRFVKMGTDDEPEFELPVEEPLIDHWVKTFNEMKADGVDVPVPIGHTTEPEKRRGTVEKMTKEVNEDGQPALFCYVRFSSPEYAEQFKDSNVSLFMPPKWTNGRGRTYRKPITHVAITDYPVIPDLSKFSAVAASMGKYGAVAASYELSMATDEGEDDMPGIDWAAVAQELGVDCPEGEDPKKCVQEAWHAGEEGGDGMGVDDDIEEGMEDDTFDVDEDALQDLGDGVDYPEHDREGQDADAARRRAAMARRGMGGGSSNYDPPPSLGFSMPPTMAKAMARGRVEQLRGLLGACKINRQQYEVLAKKYCKPSTVAYAMSMESVDPTMTDGFDAMVAMCSLATPFATIGEQTRAQLEDQIGRAERSPVVIDAERRAAAANGQRR